MSSRPAHSLGRRMGEESRSRVGPNLAVNRCWSEQTKEGTSSIRVATDSPILRKSGAVDIRKGIPGSSGLDSRAYVGRMGRNSCRSRGMLVSMRLQR
jgi:hypothetical protein